MSYVGYSGVANLALTHPGWAEGVAAMTAPSKEIGEGVAGNTTIWLGDGLQLGFILMETSGGSSPQDYVLEENLDRIRLEVY